MRAAAAFLAGALRAVTRGGPAYWAWVVLLVALIASGVEPYARQLREGLVVTGMRDPMSWGLYIGNFTFLVGVAAASVTLVVPAYFHGSAPFKHVALFGELLAISAVAMCVLFVTVDVGRPERVLELAPLVGRLHLPQSLLAWDILVLGGYFVLNAVIVVYLLGCSFRGRPYDRRIAYPLIFASVPLAIGIHTVTAFIYSGLAARPAWHTAVLAPRFLASAACSGLAVMVIVLQVLERLTRLRVDPRVVRTLAVLLAYAAATNLFLRGAELFTEHYAATRHLAHATYLYQGLGERRAMVPFVWLGLTADLLALGLLLVPWCRRRFLPLNAACALAFCGVYVEKGMAFVVMGFTPTPLGEVFEYRPTTVELRIAAAIFSAGFLLFTLLCKVAIPIETGELRAPSAATAPPPSRP